MTGNITQRTNELIAHSKQVRESISNSLVSIKELSNICGASEDTIKNCIRRIMPDKMKNGIKTLLDEKETTLILDEIKNNQKVMEQMTYEAGSQVQNTSTTLTPALKIKRAMELMQEGYEEELRILQDQLQQKEKENQLLIENQQAIILSKKKKLETQETWKQIIKQIRKKAELDFNNDYREATIYYYQKFRNIHCIDRDEPINKNFFFKYTEYMRELLDIVISDITL